MWYKDKIKLYNEGTDLEIKEVIADVEFSMGDLVELKKALEASASSGILEHPTQEWVRCTLEDIDSSLNKL